MAEGWVSESRPPEPRAIRLGPFFIRRAQRLCWPPGQPDNFTDILISVVYKKRKSFGHLHRYRYHHLISRTITTTNSWVNYGAIVGQVWVKCVTSVGQASVGQMCVNFG